MSHIDTTTPAAPTAGRVDYCGTCRYNVAREAEHELLCLYNFQLLDDDERHHPCPFWRTR